MDRWTTPVRLLTGLAFVIAGLPKFVAHDWETRAFDSFGLPWPHAFVILIGVVEIAGGVLMLCDSLNRPIRIAVSVDDSFMRDTCDDAHHSVCAEWRILLCGRRRSHNVRNARLDDDLVRSLTVAPLLLAATLFLLRPRPAPG